MIVPGATHLFEEPGTLDEVVRLAANWLQLHLKGRGRLTPRPEVPTSDPKYGFACSVNWASTSSAPPERYLCAIRSLID